jgi:predicted nucleic acid-binding protein
MRRVFFDTSAYIALADSSDQYHARAAELAAMIRASRLPRVTTNYVLAEAITWLRRKLGHAQALRFGDAIRRDAAARHLQIVYADTWLDEEAWAIFQRFEDQSFSFVDCASFAWLRHNPDTEFFAFDEHFGWMGFAPYEA